MFCRQKSGFYGSVFIYSLFSEISIGSFYVALVHESRGRLGTCLLFCMASVFAPLYACTYASGLPAFVHTFVLGKLRSATCTAHVHACVAAAVHRYFCKCGILSTSFDGREVLVPFDCYAVLTVICPTLPYMG